VNGSQAPVGGVERGGFASFEECYERTVDALLTRGIMLCGDREQAEQAVAETFIEMSMKWEQIRTPWGWAVKVMTRKLAAIAKRDRYRRIKELRHALLEVRVPPGLSPEERAEVALVMRALHALPLRQRQVVVLYYPCDQTQQQIAEILGISRDAVAEYLSVAIHKLQRKLGVTAPPARRGGKFAPRPAPAGTTAAMADQVAARLLAVTVWLAEGNSTDEDAHERIRQQISQRIDTRLPGPREGESQ
jgi:RNA polymerase sigma factor (sigma-70 family)